MSGSKEDLFHYFGHWCYCSIFLLVARPSIPPRSPFESHSVALPLDEATRSGRSPRDFRPLQSNPWCRHCLCNAYLRLFQGQWWNFWKCHVWLVYPCISHVWLVYIPSTAGNSWHISYVNVWLPSSQLAEIHSSRGHCPIVKIVQKPHGETIVLDAHEVTILHPHVTLWYIIIYKQVYHHKSSTLWWTNIAMENSPFIDGLPGFTYYVK